MGWDMYRVAGMVLEFLIPVSRIPSLFERGQQGGKLLASSTGAFWL